MVQKVLFLCTGNYYRSRFAELLFNRLAREAGLDWQADSRGVATEMGAGLGGPMSPTAIDALRLRGVDIEGEPRFPLQVQPADLESAQMVIALDEQEHRSYLADRCPGWEERVAYWHVHDLGQTPASVALAEIEREVRGLIAQLQQTQSQA